MSYRIRLLSVLSLAAALVIVSACTDTPPSERSIDEAWRRADLALQQTAAARDEARHQQRLREIDRVRLTRTTEELESTVTLLRGWTIVVSLLAAACLVRLAVEVRRHRVLRAALVGISKREEVSNDSH